MTETVTTEYQMFSTVTVESITAAAQTEDATDVSVILIVVASIFAASLIISIYCWIGCRLLKKKHVLDDRRELGRIGDAQGDEEMVPMMR